MLRPDSGDKSGEGSTGVDAFTVSQCALSVSVYVTAVAVGHAASRGWAYTLVSRKTQMLMQYRTICSYM